MTRHHLAMKPFFQVVKPEANPILICYIIGKVLNVVTLIIVIVTAIRYSLVNFA